MKFYKGLKIKRTYLYVYDSQKKLIQIDFSETIKLLQKLWFKRSY